MISTSLVSHKKSAFPETRGLREMANSSKSNWLSLGARDLGTTWTASAVVLLPIRSSTSMEKQSPVILPTTMASTNGNRQCSEELRRRLCKPISSSVKGVRSSAAREVEKQQQQSSCLSPTIVDARSITPEEFNKMASVATGKVTEGRDGSPTQQREFLQAGQVFLTQNNMNTGFAFASSAPFLTSHVPSYEKHPRDSVKKSLASLKKGLVEYLSKVKASKQKGLPEAERPKGPVETASQPWAQNSRMGWKPLGSSTKGTAAPAATIKPLPSTARNDEVAEYHVVSKPQPYPGPRTIHKVPNAELPETKPIDLSQAGRATCRQPCPDNQGSLKEEIDDLKEKIIETEKDLQKFGNMKDGVSVSDTTDSFQQQHEPLDLTVSKKSNHEAPVPSSTTDLHDSGKDCSSDSIMEGKRSLRASTKTDTLATRNSLLQDKLRKGKRKPSGELHRSGKASAKNGLPMKHDGLTILPDSCSTSEKVGTTKVPMYGNTDKGISSNRKRKYDVSVHPKDKSWCPTVGKHGRLDEMVKALSKRLGDAYCPWYGIDYR